MGDGVLNPAISQGTSQIITSSTFVISTIPTNSLPPFVSKVITTTSSPTFENILDQPITSLFASQSTDPPKVISNDETDGGGFGGSFADLEFDPEEENISDHLLMSGKQFQILNRKLNSIH